MLAYQSRVSAVATIVGITPYSQCRMHNEPEYENEDKGEYDKRTYLSHLHLSEQGEIVIPSFGMHSCLVSSAQYSGKKIKGQGARAMTRSW
jgi:hypothetical protein